MKSTRAIPGGAADEIRRRLGWGPQNAEGGVRASFFCEYCGKDLLESADSYDSWQIDHIVPKSSEPDESLHNVALACRACNHLKHTYSPRGTSRVERVEDASRYIQEQRAKKREELNVLRGILGLSPVAE